MSCDKDCIHKTIAKPICIVSNMTVPKFSHHDNILLEALLMTWCESRNVRHHHALSYVVKGIIIDCHALTLVIFNISVFFIFWLGQGVTRVRMLVFVLSRGFCRSRCFCRSSYLQ
jgi:hypothetical protein